MTSPLTPTPDVPPDLALRPREAAMALAVDARALGRLLGLSVRTIRAMDCAGKLPRPLRFGHSVRWRVDEVRAWLAVGAPDRRSWEARNRSRFPSDFMFQLTKAEKAEVVTICDHLQRLKFSPVLPWAFTEHGTIMAANLLNSARAVQVSIYVVRAFIHLRKMLASHADLTRKLDALERKYDAQFRVVFDTIRRLMASPPEPKCPPMGFGAIAEGRKKA